MRCSIAIALAALVIVAAPGQAQTLRANCPACQRIVDQINELERKWEEAERQYINELGEAMSLQRANINDRVMIDQIRREFTTQTGRIKEFEDRIASREAPIKEHNDRAVHYSKQARAIRDEISGLKIDLELCNLQCTGGAPPQPPPPNPPPPPSNPPANTNDPVPVPQCPVCKDVATRLNDLLQQRRAAQGTLQGIDAAKQAHRERAAELAAQLDRLNRGTPQDRIRERAGDVEDRMNFENEEINNLDHYKEFWEGEVKRLDADIQRVQEEMDRCNRACAPRQTSFRNPRMIGAVGGALVLGGVLLNGGGSEAPSVPVAAPVTPAPTANTTPVTTPPPTTAPPATTTPPPTPPPAAPTADGTYVCADCGVASDDGGHNAFVGLCPGLTGPVTVRQGSITISHAAPFVPITGDYNTTTGAFTATGRGTVAGFPNVSVRAEGSVNTSSGRITMMYTMGANGELPGGRSITYRITLQKQ